MVIHDIVNLLQDGNVGGGVVVGELAVQGANHFHKLILLLKHHSFSGLGGAGWEPFALVAYEEEGPVKFDTVGAGTVAYLEVYSASENLSLALGLYLMRIGYLCCVSIH